MEMKRNQIPHSTANSWKFRPPLTIWATIIILQSSKWEIWETLNLSQVAISQNMVLAINLADTTSSYFQKTWATLNPQKLKLSNSIPNYGEFMVSKETFRYGFDYTYLKRVCPEGHLNLCLTLRCLVQAPPRVNMALHTWHA